MRVLVVGLNYLPESTSIGPYTAALAQYILSKGHDVEVLTGFPMAPTWRTWDGYRGRCFAREQINGVPVTRAYLYVPRDPRRPLSRVAFDSSFFLTALSAGLTLSPSDIIVAVTPPLQSGLAAWLLASLWRVNFFLHVQDLVPGAAIATGMMRERSLVAGLARGLERFVYKKARRIGVICDGFHRALERNGVPPDKLRLLPNYIDLDFMRPCEGGRFRQVHRIPDGAFVVMYSGSLGLKHGLETLLDAAGLMRKDPRIRVLIVGDGPPLSDLQERAIRDGLTNVTFLPLQPRDLLPEQLAAADVLVITQKRMVTDIVFPGKLLYYMAAARPIVAAVSQHSETGRFIETTGVGVVTPPEEPQALASVIMKMTAGQAQELGRRGRAVVEQRFDQRLVLPRFVAAIEDCAGMG